MGRSFMNRREAGERLAQELLPYRGQAPVVLGLLRGGIVVAEPVAKTLEAPLEPLIARKVGAPGHAEFGMGAVAPGVTYANSDTLANLGLTKAEFDRYAEREMQEVERRQRTYLGDLEPIDLKGRTAIMVDDGLATGVTAIAAARYVRSRSPFKVVLAVPVCSRQGADTLVREVDDVVCLLQPEVFYAVGEWYDEFGQTSDGEVMEILGRNRASLR